MITTNIDYKIDRDNYCDKDTSDDDEINHDNNDEMLDDYYDTNVFLVV